LWNFLYSLQFLALLLALHHSQHSFKEFSYYFLFHVHFAHYELLNRWIILMSFLLAPLFQECSI
jgi:hypothetical protein